MRPPSADRITEWMQTIKPQLTPFCDRTLTRNDLATIAKLAFVSSMPKCKALKTDEALKAAVGSLDHLTGQEVDSKSLTKNVHRLVANLHFLADGMEIPEWDGSREYSDVVFIGVGSVQEDTNGADRFIVSIKLKTGICAGIITCAVLSRRSLSQFLLRVSGTSKSECAVEEIAGMEASLALSLAANGLLIVHSWSCNEKQKQHNRDIAEKRRNVMKCGLAPAPCNVCSKTIVECPLAVWLPKAESKE